MARRLFTFAAVVSLVMCVAVAVLWVRSRREGPGDMDRVVWQWDGVRHTAQSDDGRLTIYAPPPPTGDASARLATARAIAELENRNVAWSVSHGPLGWTRRDPELPPTSAWPSSSRGF